MATSICEKLRAGLVTHSAEACEAAAAAFARTLPPDTTLALHGDLGVGKTTFVRGLARGLGIREPVTSPTFSLYSLYRSVAEGQPPRTLLHLDAYRIETAAEVEALLLEDFLISPWILAMEKIADWLPASTQHLTLSINPADHSHSIRLHYHAER